MEPEGTTALPGHPALPGNARWCGSGKPPARCVVVDDTLTSQEAYRLATGGTAMLWSGDYHNARQLLSALGRRIPAPAPPSGVRSAASPAEVAADFYRVRQGRAHRSRILASLLVPLVPGPAVDLRRAPDIATAWRHAHGDVQGASVVPLQDLLGVLGAEQWRERGVFVPALDATIHPHYGTFAPVRGEYLDLVAEAPLPDTSTAFDLGTGTGVLAAILARRGMARIVATDLSGRAIACAADNLERLGLEQPVELAVTDMFPAGRAGLIVCNPPWLPGSATTLLDQAVYDPKSRMLRAFLAGLAGHLEPGGEGWLVISDLAEHLGLRSRAELLGWIEASGLRVLDRLDTRPTHRRSADAGDPFHAARSAEVTSLWRLAAA
ncbi:class I SAM-dependent methyltransferase [Arthrobacter rhombi]|uniref:class I SAM-dependent methyltransferase n=1 Tax=Arthrobacter rhombi TaxID=71253 RepID=UPI0031E1519B